LKKSLGSVFFRAKDFDRVANLKTFLYDHVYKFKTLLPEQYWKASTKPDEVTNIRFERVKGKPYFGLFWDGDTLDRYAIYNTTNTDYLKSENLLEIAFNNYYVPPTDKVFDDISISIVKINRFWKTGDPSEAFTISKPEIPILKFPINNYTELSRNDKFIWNISENSSIYEVEFADDILFENITNKYQLRDTFLNALSLKLEGGKDYFWRVRSANIAGYSEYSEVRKFKAGFPKTPVFIYPTNNKKDIPLQLEFQFDFSSNSDSLQLQLSRGGTGFSLLRIEIDTVVVAASKYKINHSLQKYTVYYARVKTSNSLGVSDWSDTIKFKTLMPVPSKTEIIDPKNNTGLSEDVDKVEFKWNNADGASYYLFQISEKSDFTSFVKNDNVYTGSKYTYYNPPVKKWMYARVAGKNIGGLAEWSDPIHFVLDNTIDISEIEGSDNDIFIFPNPCKDSFHISFNKKAYGSKISITIFNTNGKKIIDKNVVSIPESKVIPIDIEQFVCNPCFIRITTGKNTKTLKLFKYK